MSHRTRQFILGALLLFLTYVFADRNLDVLRAIRQRLGDGFARLGHLAAGPPPLTDRFALVNISLEAQRRLARADPLRPDRWLVGFAGSLERIAAARPESISLIFSPAQLVDPVVDEALAPAVRRAENVFLALPVGPEWPLTETVSAARFRTFVASEPDPVDNVTRRVRLAWLRQDGTIYDTSLELQLFCFFNGLNPNESRFSPETGRLELPAGEGERLSLPLDADGFATINFRATNDDITTVWLDELLDPAAPPPLALAGRHVIIPLQPVGQGRRLIHTPLGPGLSQEQVTINALIALFGRGLVRPLPAWLDLLLAAAAVLLGLGAARSRSTGRGALVLLPALALFTVASVLVVRWDLSWDFLAPYLLAPVGFTAGIIANYFRVVRELETAQQRLVRTESLMASGMMAAQLCHELNNPLHNLWNLLKGLTDGLGPADPQREYVDLAASEVQRISRLTQQLKGFYRSSPREVADVDLNQALSEVLTLSRETLSRPGITVQERLAPDLPLVLGNANQLRQVLLNLTLNAVDAMPDGGTFTVATRGEGDKVVVQVLDTGRGFDREARAHLFEPFFTTKQNTGAGLGLFTSYGIIQQHGGEIRLESAPGQGAAFTITLPAAGRRPGGKAAADEKEVHPDH